MRVIAFLLLSLYSPPVLPETGQILAESVEDDQGLVATAALDFIVNEVHGWPVEVTSANDDAQDEWPSPDWDVVLESPDSVRGEAFRIEGQLVRRDLKPLGRDTLEAWIVDCADSSNAGQTTPKETIVVAVLVAVDQVDKVQVARLPVEVRIAGRFFARLRIPAERAEEMLTIPLFVGAHPQILGTGPAADSDSALHRLTILIALIAVFGVAYVIVRIGMRRARTTATVRVRQRMLPGQTRSREESNSELSLPADPADALAVLDQNQYSSDSRESTQ